MTEASTPTLGFAVLYRWKLVPGTEVAFEEGWRAMTRLIRDQSGGLGSRLHRCADGTWAAYAQWPSRDAWERADLTDPDAPRWRAMMQDAVAERFDPILMEPVADLLVPVAGAG